MLRGRSGRERPTRRQGGAVEGEESADPASSPAATTSPTDSDPAPSETGARTAYDWVNGITPACTYSVVFVRRMTPREALTALGDVRRDAGSLTSEQALNLESDLTNPDIYAASPNRSDRQAQWWRPHLLPLRLPACRASGRLEPEGCGSSVHHHRRTGHLDRRRQERATDSGVRPVLLR